MEFRIVRSEFLRGLKLAQGIADRKSSMPMLGNVLLRTQGKNQLLVAATDLNVSLTAELKSTNVSDGGVTLHAKQLYELIANAPGDEVALKVGDGHHAEFKSGKAKYKLLGLSDRDYPKIPALDDLKLSKIPRAELREMIDRTIYAASQDDTKFSMTGVYFESTGELCRASATDSHRVALVERSIVGPVLAGGVIVPRKGLGEIRKLAEGDGDILVGVRTPTMFALSDGILISTKLIVAEFPKIQQILDSLKPTSKLTVDREQLIDSLRRVQAMTSETRGVKFTAAAGTLSLLSENPDMGEVRDEIVAEYTGKEMTIGFSPKYLIDILGSMTSDQVTIEMGSDIDPAIIRQLGDVTHTCIAMPMRL